MNKIGVPANNKPQNINKKTQNAVTNKQNFPYKSNANSESIYSRMLKKQEQLTVSKKNQNFSAKNS